LMCNETAHLLFYSRVFLTIFRIDSKRCKTLV